MGNQIVEHDVTKNASKPIDKFLELLIIRFEILFAKVFEAGELSENYRNDYKEYSINRTALDIFNTFIQTILYFYGQKIAYVKGVSN